MRFRAGVPLSVADADRLNRMERDVSRLLNLSVKLPLALRQSGGNLALTMEGGFGAAISLARTSQALDGSGQPVPDTYDITEIESFTDTDGVVKYRDKDGGVTGVGHRSPSADPTAPPIPDGQTVAFRPSANVAGEYDLTPWGGYAAPVVEELVRVGIEQTLADDGSTVTACPNYFRTLTDGARERCIAQAPAGATVSPVGDP